MHWQQLFLRYFHASPCPFSFLILILFRGVVRCVTFKWLTVPFLLGLACPRRSSSLGWAPGPIYTLVWASLFITPTYIILFASIYPYCFPNVRLAENSLLKVAVSLIPCISFPVLHAKHRNYPNQFHQPLKSKTNLTIALMIPHES